MRSARYRSRHRASRILVGRSSRILDAGGPWPPPKGDTVLKTDAYATTSSTSPLEPFSIERREPGPHDVLIDISYCGICHSDIHQARDEWGGSTYPMVPGHEIVGVVKKVGSKVKHFKPGDKVGVGCMVDSCKECDHCGDELQQFCKDGASLTYNG